MLRKTFVLLFSGLLLLSACAAPATGPASSAGSSATGSTAATAAPAAASSQPAATTAATTGASTAATAATTQSTQPAAPAAAAASATSAPQSGSGSTSAYHLVLVKDGTTARFRVKEQLAGRNLPNDAVGTTQSVTGSIVIQPDGKIDSAQSKITVDMSTLQTDESRRDNFIKRSTLQTDQYPTATFVPTSVQGLPSPLPTSGDVTFQVTGDLTIHGTTKPSTWQVKATISGQDLKGTASAAFKFGDFNMSPPRAAVVLSVEDNIRLELDFHLTRQG